MNASTINAVCPSCHATFGVATKHAGKPAKCGKCGHAFRVPEVPLPSPPPPQVEKLIDDVLSEPSPVPVSVPMRRPPPVEIALNEQGNRSVPATSTPGIRQSPIPESETAVSEATVWWILSIASGGILLTGAIVSAQGDSLGGFLAASGIGVFVSGVIGYAIAKDKGRGADGLFLGAVLGVIGWIIAACLEPSKAHRLVEARWQKEKQARIDAASIEAEAQRQAAIQRRVRELMEQNEER